MFHKARIRPSSVVVDGAEADVRNITMKLADEVSRQIQFLVCNICWMIWTSTTVSRFSLLTLLTRTPIKTTLLSRIVVVKQYERSSSNGHVVLL